MTNLFNNFGAAPIDTLSPEETRRLVALTPQGVFQLREWVSGPFGLIRSAGYRYLPPQSCGPAIRCKRIVCNQLHHIKMKSCVSDCANVRAYIASRHPVSSGFDDSLFDVMVTRDEFYRVNHPGGLPWLIGNGFTYAELSGLFEQVLADNVGDLRLRVNKLLGKTATRKSPSGIVKTLNHAALVQLLLLMDDADLVRCLEVAIDDGAISLSPTEVRYSFDTWHIRGGYFKVNAEASRLGVRFVPTKMNLTEPRMLAVIRAVFSGDHQDELGWQLRSESGTSSLEKLERCLEGQDPGRLLHRILFSSREALERTFDVLEFGQFTLPVSADAEQNLVEKILWKLGSPLPTPKVPYAALEQHLSTLTAAITTDYPDEESRVIAIRSVGMNMFVELEALLRYSAQFACWALLNDHYAVHPMDRFRYSRNRVEVFARTVFADAALELGDAFPYSGSNGNALSVLISSFRVLADICESRQARAESFSREAWQIPEFSSHSDVQRFPLLHTSLILDLRDDSRARLIDTLRSVALSLTRTDICAVRNGLGHPRETFSNDEKLIEANQAIRAAVGILATAGLMPIIRKYSGEEVDKFKRRTIRLADGNGDPVLLTAPNELMMLDLPNYEVAQVVVQDAVLTGSLQPVRFEVADDSEWVEVWHGVGLIDSWLSVPAVTVSQEGSSPEAELTGVADEAQTPPQAET